MGFFKNKKYIQGMQDGAKPFEDILNEVKNCKEDLQELGNIFSRWKYKKLLRMYYSNHPINIKIIKDKTKEDLSDDLRKLLNEQKFDATISSYERYKQTGRLNSHFTIFIGDAENIVHKWTQKVYSDKFGCKILKKNDMFCIIQDKDIYISNQDELLKYYTKVISPIQENEKLSHAIKKKQSIDFSSKSEKFLEDGKNNTDIVAVLKLFGILISLPLCLTEVAIHSVISALKSNSADKEILSRAQKQILLIKTIEIMEKERQKIYKGKF